VAKGDVTDMATKVLDNVQAMGLRPFLKVIELLYKIDDEE
jgi:hypothetical protein